MLVSRSSCAVQVPFKDLQRDCNILRGNHQVRHRALAEGLSRLPCLELDPASVETNIVLMRVRRLPAATLVGALDQAGVRVLTTGPDTVRAVTNLMVSSEDISVALEIFKRNLNGAA